jgi:xanthine permease
MNLRTFVGAPSSAQLCGRGVRAGTVLEWKAANALPSGIVFMSTEVHPVDEVLPIPKLLTLGLQHVLVMYAGAVAVPLILGRALKLSPEEVAFLISADLFACGIATLVQSVGFPGVGIRLPVMMGVTFASVGPMLSMAAAPDVGLLGIYGSVIAAGLFAFLAAPFISRLLPLFPPVVTGTIIMVIGISLMRVGINWAGGGLPTLTKVVEGVPGAFPNPGYGQLQGLGIALFVLVVILGLIRWGTGFIANVSVLLGIVAGAVLASILGVMNFTKVGTAAWVDVVTPLRFGMPQFHLVPIITMCIVMVVVMIESVGMFLALGEMTGRKIDQGDLTRGLRADGIGTMIGGVFNTFPYTSFSQNVGLVGVTGIRSRWVTAAGGGIMLFLGFLPKMAALVEAVPQVVLGGAGLVMFGMVAATGARILTAVDFKTNRFNLFVVAIAVGFGMIPLVAPNFFRYLPDELHPLLESGILLAAISSVLLNAFFNGVRSVASAQSEAAMVAAASEHV